MIFLDIARYCADVGHELAHFGFFFLVCSQERWMQRTRSKVAQRWERIGLSDPAVLYFVLYNGTESALQLDILAYFHALNSEQRCEAFIAYRLF